MTAQLLDEAFLAKTTFIKKFCIVVNPLVPIFWDLHVRGGRKLKNTHTHTHMGQPPYHRILAAHAC